MTERFTKEELEAGKEYLLARIANEGEPGSDALFAEFGRVAWQLQELQQEASDES